MMASSLASCRVMAVRTIHYRSRQSILSSYRLLFNDNRREESPQCNKSRSMSSSSWMPEFAQHYSVWGASGWVLKTIHMNGMVPYWACFSITNVLVRTSLIPLVLHSAHTAARFGKVAPEVQFLVTIFQKDLAKQQKEGASFGEQWALLRITMQTLSGIYKLHNIHPLAIFASPFAQIPVFWYFSIDLRKIINGADPALAQELTESGFFWVPDLTEADPWYGLPILAGLLLYANVEVAIGQKSLSGEAASKSKLAGYLKDFFQTIAVFMPCFMAQQPAGMQIYLCTSFLFTLGQGAALRSNHFRQLVGLPKMGGPPPEGTLAKEFMELKLLERKAQELRGNGPLLGRGVLAVGLECSFAGTNRPSTIIGSNPNGGPLPDAMLLEEAIALASGDYHARVQDEQSSNSNLNDLYGGGPFIHGISAPPEEMMERKLAAAQAAKEEEYMPDIPDEVMEAANRGERPVTMAPPDTRPKQERNLNAKQLRQRKVKKRGVAKKPRKK